MVSARTVTASSGKSPIVVSSDNITASAPSRTAFAISETSALVGYGEDTIDISIWVAIITGSPFSLAFSMICFWTTGITYGPISTPRSPRAIIRPSASTIIASILSRAAPFSILAKTGISSPSPCTSSLASWMSSADCTKESAIMSIFLEMPKRISFVSLAVIADRSSWPRGRFTPLPVVSFPPVRILTVTLSESSCSTSERMVPSAK